MSMLVMVPVIDLECETQKLHVWRGAQVNEVQAGMTFHGGLDDRQVCW